MSLFGMDAADDAFLEHALHLHDVIMAWAGSRHYCDEKQTRDALAASQELNSILLPYLRARRDSPKEDLVSRLWAEAPALLEDATEEDMLATCRELYLGGSDTTVHALSNAIYVLLTQPAVAASVRADRERALSTFIDEVLRVWGSVQYRSRVANQDIDSKGLRSAKTRWSLQSTPRAIATRRTTHAPPRSMLAAISPAIISHSTPGLAPVSAWHWPEPKCGWLSSRCWIACSMSGWIRMHRRPASWVCSPVRSVPCMWCLHKC